MNWERGPGASAPGLYVHIPFCRTKCPYCDFYSITAPYLIPAYLSALNQEAQIYHVKMPSHGGTGVSPVQAPAEACDYQTMAFPPFETLYLGGGTPSWLSEAHLAELMTILRRHFTFAPDTEITLEANPDDISAEKLRLWRDLGLNRLSLGVQSFDEAELRFLGRRHTARQTKAALDLIRAAGFANLGLDLIYGLPGQSLDAWLYTLTTALSVAPEHLSCYQLTLAPETPMGRMFAAGRLTLPDEETQRQFFLRTADFLTAHGYLHYEVANFARQGPQAGGLCHYCCRHNLKYWTRTPYLGLGPGAHSFQAGRRWWNFSSVEQYCASLSAGAAPLAGSETLTPAQIRLETLALGFRTRDGVSLATLREQPNADAILAELTRAGLIRVERGRVIATDRGLVVADRLPLSFADAPASDRLPQFPPPAPPRTPFIRLLHY
jgi:putative oxygen-independent coproporphyrinogen III oxidase